MSRQAREERVEGGWSVPSYKDDRAAAMKGAKEAIGGRKSRHARVKATGWVKERPRGAGNQGPRHLREDGRPKGGGRSGLMSQLRPAKRK